MARPIHHALVKKAAKHGVSIVLDAEDAFRIAKGNRLSIESFDSAKEALDEFIAGHVEFDKSKAGYCGVMVAVYHDRYEHNSHGPGSCDGLDIALRDAYTLDSGVDVDGLFELGRKLGLWNESWESLNPGMKRMNLSNRIRAWLRNNAQASLTIGKQSGRFNVPYQPSKRIAKKAA